MSGSNITEWIRSLNKSLLQKPTPPDININLEKCCLQLKVSSKVSFDPTEILATARKFLLEDNKDDLVDLNLLTDLLNSLTNICEFEDVLKVFTVHDLELALNSDIIELQLISLNIIMRSSPKGILASTDIFDLILMIYFDKNTEVTIINAIDNVFASLISNELVRKRIFENNHILLKRVREKYESYSFVRLLELLNLTIAHTTRNEIDESLYFITSNELIQFGKHDIMLFVQSLQYYTNILLATNVQCFPKGRYSWIIEGCCSSFSAVAKIFSSLENFEEVESFAMSYMFTYFKCISEIETEEQFKAIDTKYNLISQENKYLINFLSFVNPKYLLKYHRNILCDYSTVSPSHLSILRNVISDQNSFNLIKQNLISEKILNMPYMEQMVLLQKLSQFEYSAIYTIQSTPIVMLNLLNHKNKEITEPETAQLRQDTIFNFLKFDKHLLGQFCEPLLLEKEKYKGKVGKDPIPEVATVHS